MIDSRGASWRSGFLFPKPIREPTPQGPPDGLVRVL